MKDTLRTGIAYTFTYQVPQNKTVPALYPESTEFQIMPKVFATGFMVGLMEWTCIQAVNPHIEWPKEQTVGIHIDVNHVAATPPGLAVRVSVKLVEVDGRKLKFEVLAEDDREIISRGTHERFVIDAEAFNRKVQEKASIVSSRE